MFSFSSCLLRCAKKQLDVINFMPRQPWPMAAVWRSDSNICTAQMTRDQQLDDTNRYWWPCWGNNLIATKVFLFINGVQNSWSSSLPRSRPLRAIKPPDIPELGMRAARFFEPQLGLKELIHRLTDTRTERLRSGRTLRAVLVKSGILNKSRVVKHKENMGANW